MKCYSKRQFQRRLRPLVAQTKGLSLVGGDAIATKNHFDVENVLFNIPTGLYPFGGQPISERERKARRTGDCIITAYLRSA